MPTPEIPVQVQERPEQFPEIPQTGVVPTQTNVKPVYDNKGKPLVSTSVTTSATIQPPSNIKSLIAKAKGKVSDAATWLAKFFLRMIAKEKYANSNDRD